MLSPQFSPFPVLETERCVLRLLSLEDVPQLLRLRSDERVMKYIDREPSTTEAEVEALVKVILENVEGNNGITWAMCVKGSNDLVGTAGLWRIDKPNHRAEVGYALLHDYWGKGLMTEVIRRIVRFGFDEMALHSIEATINPGNDMSRRLLENLGFVREAYFRENHYFRGQFLDSEVLSLLAPGR